MPEEYLKRGNYHRLVGTEIEAGRCAAERGGFWEMVHPSVTREQGDPGESADGGGGSGEPEDGIGYAGSEKNLL